MSLSEPNSIFTVAAMFLLCGMVGCEPNHSAPVDRVKTEELPQLPNTMVAKELPRSSTKPGRDLTLAIVGEVRGELEPCGCPTLPFGGFERRDTLLGQLRNKGPGPTFHVDAGDMLIKGFSTRRIDDVKNRAKEMLNMSKMVGVDAWVPGTSDLMALSIEEMMKYPGPPRVSATWLDTKGEPIFPRHRVLKREGLQVAIVGISARPPSDSGVVFAEPSKAVQQAVQEIPEGVDWVVGVGNITDQEAKALLKDVDGLSAMFTTRGAVYTEPSEDNLDPPVIETPDRGRYVQVVHVRLGTQKDSPMLVHPEKAEWRARLAAVQREETDVFEAIGAGRNLALINTVPLSAELDQAGAVSQKLSAYQAERLQQAAVQAEQIAPHENAYASSGGCVNCHSDEFARWTLTGHARSWRALLERKATQNPECVACHTTGFGEPGGLGELTTKNIRKFKGVQCEECHGPMKGHPSDDRVHARPITEDTCLKCHDEANSPKFEYDHYLAQATCQGGAPAIIPATPQAP